MKTFIIAIVNVIISLSFIASPALAGQATEDLSTCLVDNTTGKDKKLLAKWIFTVMASHPDIKPLSNINQEKKEELDKSMANLFTKLITKNCLSQTQLTLEKEGTEGLKNSFSVFGKLAMQELMSHSIINTSISNFTKHIDQKKFSSIYSK